MTSAVSRHVRMERHGGEFDCRWVLDAVASRTAIKDDGLVLGDVASQLVEREGREESSEVTRKERLGSVDR